MRRAALVVSAAAAALAFAACAGAPSDARIGVLTPPEDQFPPVGDLLVHRCGTLDCHGNAQRNLKIYGCEGLRLDPMATPGCRSMVAGGTNTTAAEYDATFRSLVGLEPTVMSNVVHQGGTNPELLTFVRKARGDEQHRGGVLITPGDNQDICITSWLAAENGRTTNTDACTQAIAPPTP
jgi:hypothetical protein